jgi:hypothetical protein
VLGRLRSTAAALDAFATEADARELPEPRPAPRDADAADLAGEQETEVIDAVADDADVQTDEDSDGDGPAPRAAMRRRITGSRPARPPKRQPAESGRARRAD